MTKRMMASEKQTSKLVPILWFTAAALALAAAIVRFGADREIQWTLLAATAFLIAMGVGSVKRKRTEPR